jgi:hypothetical protein
MLVHGSQGAMDTCLAAAGYEHHVPLQQMLLRAAAYGASFMQVTDLGQGLRV